MTRRPTVGQRVRIVGGPFAGADGEVYSNLFRRTPESWVRLDARHPTAPHPFPADDAPGRGTHALILWADMVAL